MKHTLTLVALLAAASTAGAATRGWQTGESSAREARFRLSVGNGHACAALYDGTVRCWGNNDSGQLGNGTTTESATPVVVLTRAGAVTRPLSGVIAVSAGANAFTCALTSNGRVFCWGRRVIGQIGDGVDDFLSLQPLATLVTAFTGAVRMAAGINGACALLAGGTVKCWGDRSTVTPFGPDTVAGLTPALDLSAGQLLSCFLVAGGGVRCNGDNSFGTLGNGTTGGFSFDPVPVNNLSEASFLASARNSVCAVGPQGQIRCWGRNNEGQLGIGNNVNQNSPSSPVFQINNGVSVDGGFEHFCALTAAGLVKCWGSNVNGQLGDGTLTNSNQPVQVPNLAQAIAVSAGGFSSCAMKADGSVVCWGSGLGSRDQFPVPVPVPGIAGGVSAKAVATGTHSCAIRANGAVACWGDNGPNGELLGNGTGPAQIPNPTTVNGLAGVTAVTVGIEHSCVLIADGTVKCWGRNSRGQIGNSTAVDQPLPAPVGLKDVVAIHAGSFHTCAVLVTGQVLCWGANESGQLAIQADTQDRRQPNLVLVTNAVSLGAGRAHTCVARADASVFCWGGGAFGQIGNGGVTAVNTIPQAVPSLANILALNAGVDHSCAVNASGVLRCWGRNDRGQTGNGVSGGNALTPAPVAGLPAIATLTAGGAAHTCAADVNSGASCWGANAQGQLGLGNATFRGQDSPVAVPGLGNVVALAAGANTTCALLGSGALECWGNNNTGQLGDGTLTNRPSPTTVPSFTLNIVPAAKLSSSNPRKLTVNIVANCEQGEQIHVRVQVRQASGTAGHGNETTRCAGYLATFPVDVTAQGQLPFALGAATVEAVAEIRDRGERERQEWTRAVQIVP